MVSCINLQFAIKFLNKCLFGMALPIVDTDAGFEINCLRVSTNVVYFHERQMDEIRKKPSAITVYEIGNIYLSKYDREYDKISINIHLSWPVYP